MIYASKKNIVIVCTVLALFALGLAASLNLYPMAQVAARFGAPEMKRLQKFYLRTWQYTEMYPKSSYVPNGGQNTGTYTSESGPGGNSLDQSISFPGAGWRFRGPLDHDLGAEGESRRRRFTSLMFLEMISPARS